VGEANLSATGSPLELLEPVMQGWKNSTKMGHVKGQDHGSQTSKVYCIT